MDSILSTAAGSGGRGAQIDIGGNDIAILSSLPQNAPADGVLRITAASLTNLHADSLLIGGTRTDNADGTTTLNVTSAGHPAAERRVDSAVGRRGSARCDVEPDDRGRVGDRRDRHVVGSTDRCLSDRLDRHRRRRRHGARCFASPTGRSGWFRASTARTRRRWTSALRRCPAMT
ncbi:MAG: hypothetical protein WDN03_16275 [Rhizomicrobium sp.]